MKRLAIFCFLLASPLWAVTPREQLADPTLEARARALSVELRCLVCQNQSIDDSDAPLARDLRALVRAQIIAGRSDDEILQDVTARYGDFVRLRPPLKPITWLLWGLPYLFLLIGAWVFFRLLKQQGQEQD